MNYAILFLSIALCLSAMGYPATVISVADGDTVTVLDQSQQKIKIRLAGIDTPEKKQACGLQAQQTLSEKVFHQLVDVRPQTKDRYGRTVADLYLGSRWVNLEIVQSGFAWHYKQYSKSMALAQAELAARKAKTGLWADAHPIAPWDYRRGASQHRPISSIQTTGTGYWLNTETGTRHNPSCRYYQHTSKGKPCGPDDGTPCGTCGG